MEVIVKSFPKIPLSMVALLAAAVLVGSTTPANASPYTNPSSPSIAQDGSQGSSAASVAGNWQMSWAGRDGSPKQGSMQIKQDGTKLSGTFQAPRGSTKLSGSLQGNQITIEIKAGPQHLSFSGTVDGDKMSGTTTSGSAWSATRQ